MVVGDRGGVVDSRMHANLFQWLCVGNCVVTVKVDPPCRNVTALCYYCSDGHQLYGTSPPMQKNGTWVGVLSRKHSVTSLMDKFVGIKLIKAHKGQIFK